MKQRELIINLKWANIFGLIMAAVIFIVSEILWKKIWGDGTESSGHSFTQGPLECLFILAAMMVGFVVHELIHGLTWARYTDEGWKSISFGIKWKMLTPYCHCSEPLKLNHYLRGALMPLLVLGVVPWIIGFCFGWGMVTAFGALFIAAAAGDILVAWRLRREDATAMVLDHPSEVGCIILEEQ